MLLFFAPRRISSARVASDIAARRVLYTEGMEQRRVLVAYITQSGYTRVVGKAIAQRLRDAGFEVDVADLELCTRHPERYDAVVLGCAEHHRHHAPPLATWIEENRDALEARVTAMFSVGHGDHTSALFAKTKWRPKHVLLLSATEEPLLRRLAREWRAEPCTTPPTLDWARIDAFIDDLVPVIGTGPRLANFRVLPFGWPTRKVSIAR